MGSGVGVTGGVCAEPFAEGSLMPQVLQSELTADAGDRTAQFLPQALRTAARCRGDLGPAPAQGPLFGQMSFVGGQALAELGQQLLVGDVLAGAARDG